MPDALIGHSGFVGTTLLKQRSFESLYRSTNIGEISGRQFGEVLCAAAPAQKWVANKNPEADQRNIDGLMEHLKTIEAKTFVLISTVDVFKSPVGVTEASTAIEEDLHAYGLNRLRLEQFVASHFERHLIVRLPGLVGPGLRKNVIFDFLNENNLQAIDSRGVFQFYPMVNLWSDIQVALSAGLNLVHLTAEPVPVAQVAEEGFGRTFEQHILPKAPAYDFRSQHAELFGGSSFYQYSARETLLAVRAYAQSETRTLDPVGPK